MWALRSRLQSHCLLIAAISPGPVLVRYRFIHERIAPGYKPMPVDCCHQPRFCFIRYGFIRERFAPKLDELVAYHIEKGWRSDIQNQTGWGENIHKKTQGLRAKSRSRSSTRIFWKPARTLWSSSLCLRPYTAAEDASQFFIYCSACLGSRRRDWWWISL